MFIGGTIYSLKAKVEEEHGRVYVFLSENGKEKHHYIGLTAEEAE